MSMFSDDLCCDISVFMVEAETSLKTEYRWGIMNVRKEELPELITRAENQLDKMVSDLEDKRLWLKLLKEANQKEDRPIDRQN